MKNIILILLLCFTFSCCAKKKETASKWSIEITVKKLFTMNSYYINSEGLGLTCIILDDCNQNIELYSYTREEMLKIYEAFLILKNQNIEWECFDASIRDGMNVKILFHGENIKLNLDLEYCAIEQLGDIFSNFIVLLEDTIANKVKESVFDLYFLPTPPIK